MWGVVETLHVLEDFHVTVTVPLRASLRTVSSEQGQLSNHGASLGNDVLCRVRVSSGQSSMQDCYSRSKSSSLSRYFMMFLLIFDESTHVTKSSMFLS